MFYRIGPHIVNAGLVGLVINRGDSFVVFFSPDNTLRVSVQAAAQIEAMLAAEGFIAGNCGAHLNPRFIQTVDQELLFSVDVFDRAWIVQEPQEQARVMAWVAGPHPKQRKSS
jgi:hypothetical protein